MDRAVIARVCLAVVVAALAANTAYADRPRLRIGDPLPDLELPRVGGGKLQLRTLRGQTVAISFFSVYCRPCRIELPTLARVLDRVNRDLPAKRRVLPLIITLDAAPEPAILARLGPTARVLVDKAGKARAAFDPRTYPCTFLVDVRGQVRHINRGFGSGYEARVERWLRAMLGLGG
jgi:cytochrome oxidase Cu insertion factor (SCO1/SenC/PrrC family)